MRLSHIVISLPVLFCTAQLSQPISLSQAAPMDAAQATEMLAKSHAINVKCNVLDADQSQNLKDFVARAEISLAEKASVSIARKAISSGKAKGAAAVCDKTKKKMVNNVLAAASAAVTSSDEVQSVANVPAEKPQVNAVAVVDPAPVPKPLKSVNLAKSPKPITKAKMVAPAKSVTPVETMKPAKGLKTYAAVAEKYYLASRCGTLSKRAINTLYSEVLANHQQALVANRPNAVRSMLKSAEARAGAKSCS